MADAAEPRRTPSAPRRSLLTASLAAAAGSLALSQATAQSASASTLSASISPSGDTTGATDTAAISAALVTNAAILLLPGTFYLNATLAIPGGASLAGSNFGTKVVPVGAIGAMFSLAGDNSSIGSLQPYGGTNTRSSNPAADVITVASGVIRWWVTDIDANYCNGWVINPVIAGASHGTISAIKGTNNAGGIRLAAASTQSAQINVSDVDLQSCEVSEALYLQNVNDILVSSFNSSVLGGANVSTMHLSGTCESCAITGPDCGVIGTAGTAPVLLIEDGAAGSPAEIDISGGVFQAGAVGVAVNGRAARLRFRGIMAKKNRGDGWQFNGTGTAILVDGCAANTNNAAAGTAYDVNVTSSAHVGLLGFAYCSTGCTARRNITLSSNHVTDANSTSPGGLGTAGSSPAGW